MNILHISPYFPSLEANHAGGVCMGKEIEELKNKNNVFVLTFVQNKKEDELYKSCNKENIDAVRLSSFGKLKNVLLHLLTPPYFAVRTSKKFYSEMKRIIEENKVDVIHAEYASMGQYVKIKKSFPELKFNLVLHDITAQSYERKLMNSRNFFERAILFFQKKLIIIRERQYVLCADNVLVFSKKDKDALNFYYGFDSAIVINTYFNLEKETKLGLERVLNHDFSNNNICFMGQMGRKENSDAALRLIEIFKLLNLEESKLFIVGNNPPKELCERAKEIDNVVVTGFVDDVDYYMLNSAIAVFPLDVGAGIKIKVLHSMALGIPTITTKVGAEGIDEEGNYLSIVNTNAEFVERIKELLSDEREYWEISSQSYSYILENFKWETTVNEFNKLYSA